MIKGVEIGILTPTRINDARSGLAFLQMLKPPFEPERYGSYEPVELAFDSRNLEGPLSLWGHGLLWVRRPRIAGQVVFGRRDFHHGIYLSLPMKAFSLEASLDLMTQISSEFSIDIAYVHLRTSQDTENLEIYQNHIMPFSQGLSTRHLRYVLPGLC